MQTGCDPYGREEVTHMSQLPKDPMLLVSVLNTKLRDYYNNLEELCADLDVNKQELLERLSAIDYEYDAQSNQFR